MNKLVTLRNFKLYKPSDAVTAPTDALFLMSSEGVDWYQSQTNFSQGTRKIAYGLSGLILAQNSDVSAIWPIEMSVSEILEKDLPSDFPASGESAQGWMFEDGCIIQVSIDFTAIAEKEKSKLLTEASMMIAVLQDAFELKMSTEEENKSLVEWKRYRVLLSRVDPGKPEWPPKPTQ
ncbi:tail fiber assembly protein [Enterobacter bugandensis]|uniref:tail fiber assembly protein n=1 Tax=Enterobacter bugandensis TaxID=881260 RepID=UPI002005129D|nr:tail fiber assembly protein [Enterobacter bugandensis]MCK6961346.1 tail fiber assembly protein [Enterobacter bugandensis]